VKSLRAAYFDCYSGISGDMILGAMVDLGVDIKEIRNALKKIDLKGYKLHSKKIQRNGLASTQITVEIENLKHQHSPPHRSFSDIRKLIDQSTLPSAVKN
ncbi:uncharacterized protein METZ01_LOCUS293327, partial [marine metagenome]